MKEKYTGTLSLEWYNKQRTILLRESEHSKESDIIAPIVNWINKEDSLFYELVDAEGRGLMPYWVDKNDIRVKEARPLIFKKNYYAVNESKQGTLEGFSTEFKLKEDSKVELLSPNILIKGDNLLALNTLRKMFNHKKEEDKVKCIYIDPPYNTKQAFTNYDDNLEHSEWLTLMRDRIVLLYDLLRNDGCIFVHLDDKEVAYAKILLDEIFGRNNYINTITVEANSPSGFRATSSDMFKSCNYILCYAKNRFEFSLKKLFTEKHYDTAYRFVFDDIKIPEKDWTWQNINEVVAKENGFESSKDAKTKIGDEFDSLIALYAIENAERVFRTAAVSGGAYLKRKATVEKSKGIKNKIIRHPQDDMDYRFIGGEMVVFYKDRLVTLDGILMPGKIVTDLWTDIAWEGIAKEGGVDFPKSKKPEKLIYRILDMTTEPNDIVLDCFCGSGTTMAVAHKMGRRWIGIEMGKHAESLIIPRLKNVISGEDQSGISKIEEVKWKGGGSFKFYQLGESIIKFNKDNSIDFNWKLGKDFIEESFLLSYDYELITDFNFNEGKLFKDDSETPKIGIQKIGNKVRIAIITLCPPDSDNIMLKYDELHSMYKKVMDKYKPEFINVFTNKGVEIAFETKPEKLEVIKVPTAIYSAND